MTEVKRLKFYATHTHPCSYLPDQQATTVFLDPTLLLDTPLYTELSELGFRRSGEHIYKPHCGACQACIPIRIRCTEFQPNRTQRKVLHHNADLSISSSEACYTDEIYDLYARYIEARHADGDMYPPSPEQFRTFLGEPLPFSRFHLFRAEGRLLAVAVTDHLTHGLSAVYTFYDPQEERRSLGRFAILWQIAEARRLGLQYLYLGYWIKECRKMTYKLQYRPAELLVNQHWRLLT